MPAQTPYGTPTGLLSFVYNVTYNRKVTQDFNEDANATMAKFDLSAEEIQAVNAAGEPGEPNDDLLMNVLKLILPQLQNTYHQSW